MRKVFISGLSLLITGSILLFAGMFLFRQKWAYEDYSVYQWITGAILAIGTGLLLYWKYKAGAGNKVLIYVLVWALILLAALVIGEQRFGS